jgi:putative ABC transport system ATP-binding protein
MSRHWKRMVAVTAEPRPAAPSDIIRLTNVRFAWPGANAFSLAVDAFALPAGQRILLIGPSGSGKSTFLSLLCGIVAPQSGQIDILGSDLTRLSASARDGFRAEHFGIIFQMFNLLPYGTVIDNVLLPLSFAPKRRQRATANGSAEEEAAACWRGWAWRRILCASSAANLSVGQQQRVAAARALIGRPELIVADEPDLALDRDRQAAFLELLFTEVREAGATLIMVSHDQTLAERFDRVMRLDDIATCRQGAKP